MRKRCTIYQIIIANILVIAGGCTPPPISVVILDWNGVGEIVRGGYLTEYHVYARRTYTVETFNLRLREAYEVELFLNRQGRIFADSMQISIDSVSYYVDKYLHKLPVDSVNALEVYDESAFAGKARGSAAFAGSFAGAVALGYLGPHTPKLKSFAIASGIGLGIGLVFVGRISEKCFIARRSDLKMDDEYMMEKYFKYESARLNESAEGDSLSEF